MPAIAKLVQGAMTATSHAAEALAKTVARARSYMQLFGNALSDMAYADLCQLKRKILKAVAREPSLATPADLAENPAGELTGDQASRISDEASKQLGKLVKDRQRHRSLKWYERLTRNWRKTLAKALFRYIRNDN